MYENKLLTEVQNIIDTYNTHIIELQNNLLYGSVSDERKKNYLESTIKNLKSITSRHDHFDANLKASEKHFHGWWDLEGKEVYKYCSDEIIERVRKSCEVAWSNGAAIALEPVVIMKSDDL